MHGSYKKKRNGSPKEIIPPKKPKKFGDARDAYLAAPDKEKPAWPCTSENSFSTMPRRQSRPVLDKATGTHTFS